MQVLLTLWNCSLKSTMSNTHILSEENQSVQQNVELIHFEIDNKLNNKDPTDASVQKQSKDAPTALLTEAKIMCLLAIPISIASIADFSMWTTDLIFLGHLGTKQLAGLFIIRRPETIPKFSKSY